MGLNLPKVLVLSLQLLPRGFWVRGRSLLRLGENLKTSIRSLFGFRGLALCALLGTSAAFGVDPELLRCWDRFASVGRVITAWSWSAKPTATGRYHLAERLLAEQRKKLSPEEYARFEEWYYDHFFSDRWATLQDNMGSEKPYLHHSNRYDKDGEAPFVGYLAAHGKLDAKPFGEMGIEGLDDVHEALMSWKSQPGATAWFAGWFRRNSEQTPSHQIGRTRSTQVGFNPGKIERDLTRLWRASVEATPSESPTTVEAIDSYNPYLLFVPASEETRPWITYLPMSRWRRFREALTPQLQAKLIRLEQALGALETPQMEAELAKRTSETQKAAQKELIEKWAEITGRFERGRIKQEKMQELLDAEAKRIEAETKAAIEGHRRVLFAQSRRLDGQSKDLDRARDEFVRQVFAHRWEKAKADLKAAKTQGEIIEAVADFYYDFVSIHPYRNGNGRMGRLLAEKMLGHYNLPPPLWTHMGEDVLLSRQDFVGLFRDAVDVSREFHQDLEKLMNEGIPHTGVGVGFFAGQVDPQVAKKNQIDADEFLSWVAAGTRKHDTVEKAIEEFVAWKAAQPGSRGGQNGNRLATSLFTGSYGRTSESEESFQAKMERFYSRRAKVARAVEVAKLPTPEEILRHFVEPARATLPSEPVEPATGFRAFNSELVRSPESVRARPEASASGNVQSHTASMVATYWSAEPVVEKIPGRAEAVVEVIARRREVAAVDTGKKASLLKADTPEADRLVLHAVGIDPEAVTQVSVQDKGSSRRWVAERLSHDRFELKELVGNRVVSVATYRLTRDGEIRKYGR
jgi:hypothetical protein